MRIAIHNFPGSFSDYWIDYCKENDIKYEIVDCYHSDIISQLREFDGVMWHWIQNDYRSMLFAKTFTFAVKEMGLHSFPDVNTSWHFDDKVGQKYLLEAIDAPLVPSHIFYSKKEAFFWANKAQFPKVFKLRGGAGSINVKLVRDKKQAKDLIRKAFGPGFKHINRMATFMDKIKTFQRDSSLSSLIGIMKGLGRFIIPTLEEKMSTNEKGYVYFQDYIPNNEYDTRLVVIGDKCLGIRRYNRKNDFRASGSGIVSFDRELIHKDCVKLAFDISKKLKSQSMAYDFILDNGNFKLVEISYCFSANTFYNCPGFWDEDLNWHEEEVIPEKFIIEAFFSKLKAKC